MTHNEPQPDTPLVTLYLSREWELIVEACRRDGRTPSNMVRVWVREGLAKTFGEDAVPSWEVPNTLPKTAIPRSKSSGFCHVRIEDEKKGREPAKCGKPEWSRGVCINHWTRIQRWRKRGFLTDEWLVAHGRLRPVPGKVYPAYVDTLDTVPKPPPRGFPRADTRWIFGWPDSMSVRHELERAAGVPSSFPAPKGEAS